MPVKHSAPSPPASLPRKAGGEAGLKQARLFAFVLLLAGCSGATSDPNRPLQWAADKEGGAPFIYADPGDTSRVLGFEVDLKDALSKELGRPIEFVQYEYASLEPGLLKRDFDFAMNGLEVTPERQAHVRFSRPYYVYEQQLVVRADENRFHNYDELKRMDGLEVGTLRDTSAERLLTQDKIKIRGYDGQREPYVDLERGQIDAVLLDFPIAVYYAEPNPKLKFAGDPMAPGSYAIAFRKDDAELAAQFDAAIGRLIEKGELEAILKKWNIWTEAQKDLGKKSASDMMAEAHDKLTFGVYIGDLLDGAKVTVQVSVLSMLLAMAIALPLAMMRLYGPKPLQWLSVAYVEFFRGIPVLLLLFFLYYGLPTVLESIGLPGIVLSPFVAAVLGFGLNYAAFEAEIYRSGIAAIPPGQWEAAASLGMPAPLTFRRIILPQAVRTIIPPMTNDFVALFKDTSVISVITVQELTKQYQILSKSSLKYAEIGLVTAALYLIMSVPLGYLSRYLEKRWSDGG